ncbi:hypothetical protein FB645_001871 [Coemansia sp. IMI 203386]|nr:hypothetical protein FB645_001871 [Coemansia sp. IMI 203386]
MFKRAVFLISLAALASAAVLPLHPRAEKASRLSDVGLILENVAIILPDESMMSEMQVAATELYMAAGQSNYLDIANRTLESYISSFEANNNPESASAWASMLIEFFDADGEPIPTGISEPYNSLLSALHNPDIAADAVDIFTELIKFVRDGYYRATEIFYSPHDLVVPTSATDSGSQEVAEESESATAPSPVDHEDSDSIGPEEDDLSDDDSAEDNTESESESSNHRSKSNYMMMLKYSTTILSLAALAHAGTVPLHPRAEAVVAPDNLGLILNNVAAAIPDEKMGSELEAAAASLIGAAGQSNYDKMANSFLDSYLSSLEANNDPAHAQEMASELVTIVQFAGDIPAEVAAPYSSFLSALKNSDIATNDADIVNEIIKLASEIYLITPELFGDNPTATGTDAESDKETGSASASDGSEPDAQSSDKEDLPSLDKDISLSDDESEHTESESKSSDASTVKHWKSGLVLAGLAVSAIASLY